jgi:hypothetical protein
MKHRNIHVYYYNNTPVDQIGQVPQLFNLPNTRQNKFYHEKVYYNVAKKWQNGNVMFLRIFFYGYNILVVLKNWYRKCRNTGRLIDKF